MKDNARIDSPEKDLINGKRIKISAIAILLLSPLFFYLWRLILRPPRTNTIKTLASGIIYNRKIFSTPRPYIVHTVAIDLKTSGIKPLVTPPAIATNNTNLAMTTSSFVEKFNLSLGINGSFFYPFKENTPWDYYPYRGEEVNALGENIANGKSYGEAGKQWKVLCFSNSNLARISLDGECPPGTQQAVAGREIIVKDGKNIADDNTEAYARTSVGINSQGNKLWLIVVDGKQPFYSEGVSLKELAEIAIDLGCNRALNLDGGGSSTLVAKQNHKVQVLNAPIHTKIPMRERPVANHLGFYSLP